MKRSIQRLISISLFTFITVFNSLNAQVNKDDVNYVLKLIDEGNHDIALPLIKQIRAKKPAEYSYFKYQFLCEMKLGKKEQAKKMLTAYIKKWPKKIRPLTDLAYFYKTEGNIEMKNETMSKIYEGLKGNPSFGYLAGGSLYKYQLLEEALKAYEVSMQLNPKLNYYYDMASVYAELGNIKMMIEMYLNLIEANKGYFRNIKRYLNSFIDEDSENPNNKYLLQALIKKNIENPLVQWNELLSWLFQKQGEYGKAFVQEKAIYKRNPVSLSSITKLGDISFKEQKYSYAEQCFNFVLENSQSLKYKIDSELKLVKLSKETTHLNDPIATEIKYKQLIQKYKSEDLLLFSVYLDFSKFLAFEMKKYGEAESFILKVLDLKINRNQISECKLLLGDIHLLQGQFNQALIKYSQSEKGANKSAISQLAKYRIAKTSFYKNDFDWALSQLKILKSATSQLISNNAADLSVLITEYTRDEISNEPLEMFAKVDFLQFKKERGEAIGLINNLITKFPDGKIVDRALIKQAELHEENNAFDKALSNYEKVVNFHESSIFIDKALYFMGNIYLDRINDFQKAEETFKKIVFEYPESIYLVDARKKYRLLVKNKTNEMQP